MSRTVIGARFQTAGRMYFFEPGPVAEDVAVNEWVIVETELGQDAARVQILPTDSPLVQVDPPLGRVVRKATATDKFELAKHKRREADSTLEAKEIARRLGLDVKILGTDWQFDGGNIVVFYSTEATAIDLSRYSTEIAAQFGTRVELRRLGARRDEDPHRRRYLRARALLLVVAGQVLEHLDPHGEGAGPSAESEQAHGGVRPAQMLPHL